MSNRVEISSNTFGFTINDDYSQAFVCFKNADDITDIKKIVIIIKESGNPDALELINFADECEKSITINDECYVYDEWSGG